MAERRMKRASESYTTQVHILTQANLNGYNRLFGGTLMSWMDIVAGVTARRHAERNVTTLKVEELIFKAPARANDTIMITGEISSVGRTSMHVLVKVYIEELSGRRKLINEASFVMVALDENEQPTMVPGLIPENKPNEALRRETPACEF